MQMKISVLGDSISSFLGYSNGVNGVAQTDCYYNTNSSSVDSVSKTWWAKVIAGKNATTLSNNAVGGSCVGYYYYQNGVEEVDNANHIGSSWCMNNTSRINYLGGLPGTTNHPDAILFFGGFNDCCRISDHNNPNWVYDGNRFF